MSIKALIIAIENYHDFLPDLPGVNAEANNLREWLIEVKQVREENIYACVEGNLPGIAGDFAWRTAGTTSGEIIAQISDLKDSGANQTEEFYFYFSGHGYSSPITPEKDVDVLVASDFNNMNAGRACISLDEIKEKLYREMGPGDHYYFIDACRNPLNVQFSNMGLRTNPSPLGTPSIYRLFSTPQGVTAKTTSGFTGALVSGLKGQGIAKDWRRGQLWVVFDRLYDYIKESIDQQEIMHYIEGTGEGRIFRVDPIPRFDLGIVIDNAAAEDEFSVEVSIDPQFPGRLVEFTGPRETIPLNPNEYFVTVKHKTEQIVPKNPPDSEYPLSLFSSREVIFTKKNPLEMFDKNFQTDITDPVILKDLLTGSKKRRRRSAEDIKPLSAISKTIRDYTSSEILKELTGPDQKADSDIEYDAGLWLSLIGASQITISPEERAEFFKLPLPSFADMKEGESRFFVLAGTTAKGSAFEAALDDNREGWQPVPRVKDAKGVFAASFAAAAGSHLLSIKRPDVPTFTYSVFCLPNRVSLFVIAEDDAKQIRIQQFVLPVWHLIKFLDPRVIRNKGDNNPLRIIRAITYAQRQFALKRGLTDENGFSQDEWKQLIHGKWLDPVMSLIGAYELLRRGQNNQDYKDLLRQMVENLRKYFPGIPDTEAIARLIGEQWSFPQDSPIMLDGLMAFNEAEEVGFAPSPDQLDYSSPWTRWFGIVG